MPTKEELLEQAAELEIEGRSAMNKDELEKAISKAQKSAPPAGGRSTGLGYREGR